MPLTRLLRCSMALAAWIAAPLQALTVDDFMLLDQHGEAHRLHYHSDAAAVVLMVQGNGCPIVRNALSDIKAVRADFEARGVRFFMINANLQDHRASIVEEALAWNIDFPILDDEAQIVGNALGLTRTAEVLVVDPTSWEVVYRGPINDRLSYERQKPAARDHYLADALEALLGGDPVTVASRDALGCLINFPTRNAAVSYRDDVAPILAEHCVACHQPGGIAPWAMNRYEMVLGFAPMMREVLRTRRMPPWHADPHVGTFQRDRRLPAEDRATLVRWIEAGAPRGAGADPLLEPLEAAPTWPLGEPDLVVDIPAFDVPAAGVVDYQFPVVANPLDRDVWVRAVTIAPGDAAVVHHILAGTTSVPGEAPRAGRESVFRNYLGGYAPGNESHVMPAGTGVFVPAGTQFLFQMHYTPSGRAVTDRSRIALYFHDAPPANFLRHDVVLDPTIRIPPGAGAHEESAYFEFERDAVLYGVLPHAHYRGKSSRFEVRYPDGRTELVLSVPSYDFNWQRSYEFAEPLALPAGSRLIHRTVYDNSPLNPGNPDPEREVPWGLQSWDEMLYGDFVFTWVDETSAAPIHDLARMEAAQWVGFSDRDMDGKVAMAELPPGMQRRFGAAFVRADANGDGGLDVGEYVALRQALRRAREERRGDAGESSSGG